MENNKTQFTPSELATLSGIFHRAWDYVAGDCLQATQECEGRDYMTKDEVIEVSLDADRPRDMARGPEEKALLKRWSALPWKQQLALARKMFRYAKYGY